MTNIAILGFGIVGSGVYELLEQNGDHINTNTGEKINIKRVLDLRDFSSHPCKADFSSDINDILNDEEISVVVETMGGVKPAYGYVKACLKAKKSVVTSNKHLVAEHGTELIAIAKDKGVCFLFEASVGGGTPIISPLHRMIATTNKIGAVYGIMNGTTNYILGRMERSGLSFDEALREAQAKGFAEADPSADIDGTDAQRKISILASIVFKNYLPPCVIPTRGIRDITLDDIRTAQKREMSIKLIAYARMDGHKLYCGVSPLLVPKQHVLSSVHGVYNGLVTSCNMLGDVMFYGQGAGSVATASAVVSDILECVNIGTSIHDTLCWGVESYNEIAPQAATLSALSDVAEL